VDRTDRDLAVINNLRRTPAGIRPGTVGGLDFCRGTTRGYDRDHKSLAVIHLTGGDIDGAGQVSLMAAQPIGSGPAGPPPHWYSPSSVYNRSYLLAALRAGVIALVLLAILVLIVLT
jgi:hypothetical protein